jgi:diguanylate cyclase (GGDEF)-like protein
MRKLLNGLLERRNFSLIEAENGLDALKQFEEHPDIKLVITDYNMPEMDGFQLVTELRKLHGKDRLGIIALSANQDPSLSARLLKSGANDFLDKDFSPEEFFARVTQNLEMLDLIQQTKDAANRDYLTKLYNRRYFFESAPTLMAMATADNAVGLTMMDIDFFKEINDGYGHDAGDQALRVMAEELKKYFPSPALVARFGGEEFCILMETASLDSFEAHLNQFRELIAETVVRESNHVFKMTLSMGATLLKPKEPIDHAIKRADENLYTSKNGGRNRVTVTQD